MKQTSRRVSKVPTGPPAATQRAARWVAKAFAEEALSKQNTMTSATAPLHREAAALVFDQGRLVG